MIKKFDLKPIITKDKPGCLIDLNINRICSENNFHFYPNHSFYITNLNEEASRGNHSNTNAPELLICLQGKFDIYLLDEQGTEYTFSLKENQAVYISSNIWIEMKNWVNCILFVFVEIQAGLKGKESIHNLEEYKKVNKLTPEYWFKEKEN